MAPRGGIEREETTELQRALGQILRLRRDSRKLTQAQTGAEHGVSLQQVSKYEQGHGITFGYVATLARMVGCSWFDIFYELHVQERVAAELSRRTGGSHEEP